MSASNLPVSNIPVPDPTTLTTEQLRRELLALRELLETRMGANDVARKLFNANAILIHEGIGKDITHLSQLHSEKFDGVQTQFKERDTRVEQTARDTKVAVDAALQAAEKAVGKQNDSNAAAITKSEAATAKQIDGILALLASNNSSLNDKIATINGRLDRGDGASGAHISNFTGTMAILAILISLFSAAYNVFNRPVAASQPQIVVAPPTSISEAPPAKK